MVGSDEIQLTGGEIDSPFGSVPVALSVSPAPACNVNEPGFPGLILIDVSGASKPTYWSNGARIEFRLPGRSVTRTVVVNTTCPDMSYSVSSSTNSAEPPNTGTSNSNGASPLTNLASAVYDRPVGPVKTPLIF